MPRDYLTGWTDEEAEYYWNLLRANPEWYDSDENGYIIPTEETPSEVVEYILSRAEWEKSGNDFDSLGLLNQILEEFGFTE